MNVCLFKLFLSAGALPFKGQYLLVCSTLRNLAPILDCSYLHTFSLSLSPQHLLQKEWSTQISNPSPLICDLTLLFCSLKSYLWSSSCYLSQRFFIPPQFFDPLSPEGATLLILPWILSSFGFCDTTVFS